MRKIARKTARLSRFILLRSCHIAFYIYIYYFHRVSFVSGYTRVSQLVNNCNEI